MYEKKIKEVIQEIQSGKLDTDHAIQALKDLPFEDLGYANIDHHREIRTGYPEVIYCEGK